MVSSALILEALKVVVPLLVGYLLRHYGISIPGLPTPAAPAGTDHVGLLQSALGLGKQEAKTLLGEALQAALQRAISDASKASQAPKS